MGNRATSNPPRPPRPKHGARSNKTRPVAPSRNAAERPRARASANSHPQTVVGTGAKRHETAVSRSGKNQHNEKSRDTLVARFGGARFEIPPVLPLSLKEGKGEEDFPALPPTDGHGQMVRQQPQPLPSAAATELVRLDYSSLAARLSFDAGVTATATASSSGAVNSMVGDNFSRLSVLPSFGDDGGDKARLRGTNTLGYSECLRSADAEDGDSGRLSSVPPPTPSQPSPSALTARKMTRVGAAAETVALRARLRERWFRLEATRKAQRQRESAERGRMAAEDGNAARVDESNGARTRRQHLVHRSGGVDEDDIAGSGHDSEEKDQSSSRDETPDQERPISPLGSSAFTTSSPQENTVAEAPCPGSNNTALGSSRNEGTNGRAARGPDALSEKSMELSAAGVAAIRRSEVVASASTATAQSTDMGVLAGPIVAWSVDKGASRLYSSDNMNTSVVVKNLDSTGPTLGWYENDKADSGLSEGGGGSHSSDVSALPEDQVHAACEAGMAGRLNGLLVRSGGRAADGKDKVRR